MEDSGANNLGESGTRRVDDPQVCGRKVVRQGLRRCATVVGIESNGYCVSLGGTDGGGGRL